MVFNTYLVQISIHHEQDCVYILWKWKLQPLYLYIFPIMPQLIQGFHYKLLKKSDSTKVILKNKVNVSY